VPLLSGKTIGMFPDPEDQPTVPLLEAAEWFGIGRSIAYDLAKRGEFPCEVLKIAGRYRAVTADARRKLGLDQPVAG
jgi:hypothetical protein